MSSIARGPAGDCCTRCGLVGINLPVEHDCSGPFVVESPARTAERPPPRSFIDDIWGARRNKPRSFIGEVVGGRKTGEAL